MANLIGARLEEDKNIRSYTYTFSAPKSVFKNDKEYKTIFNVADSNDFFIEGVQFKDENPVNYGTDIYVDVQESKEIKETLGSLKGRDDYTSLSKDKKAEFKSLFESRFTDRSTLYDKKILTETFYSEDEAKLRSNELDSI